MKGRKRGRGAVLPPDALTTASVAWLVGIHVRTLQRWIARGILAPPNAGSSTWRAYAWDLRSLAAAGAIARLRRDGVSAQRVRKAAEAILGSGLDLDRAILISDGRDVYRVISPKELLDLTGSPGQVSWRMYQLATWTKEIRARARERGITIRDTRAVA